MSLFPTKKTNPMRVAHNSYFIYIVLTDKPRDYSFESTIDESNNKVSLMGFEMRGEIIGYSGLDDELKGFQQLFKRPVTIWVNRSTTTLNSDSYSGYAIPDDDGSFFLHLKLDPLETERFLFVIDRMWKSYGNEIGLLNCDDPDINEVYKRAYRLSLNVELRKQLDVDREIWWCQSFDITETRLPTDNFYSYEKIIKNQSNF
jgi:hypothetical protein